MQRLNAFNLQLTGNARGFCLWLTTRRGNAYFTAVERHDFSLLPKIIRDDRHPVHLCWLGLALTVGRIAAQKY